MAPSVSGASTGFGDADTPVSATFSRAPLVNGVGNLAGSPPPPPVPSALAPVAPVRRPIQLLRRIGSTTTSSAGGYLSPRLYVPKTVWTQTGIKLQALETKVRVLDLLVAGLETLDRAGDPLLNAPPASGTAIAASLRTAAGAFVRELDMFDALLDEIQSTLAKKLGSSVEGLKGGKKSGQLGTWSSKLSRSFDRMTTTKKCVGR